MSVNHDKDAALNQALNLFWTKGFASTSIKDLERATGMHPGSIYAAFGSKAKLYCLSLERYALQLNEKRAQLMASAASPLQGLADFILCAHPLSNADAPLPVCFLVKATLESGLDDGSVHDKINEMLTRNEELFEDIFEQAIAAGELSQASNPKKLARQLSADLAGLCFYALRRDDPTVINEMITDLADRVRQSH